MKQLLSVLFIITVLTTANAQSIEKLYSERNYKKLIKHAQDESLTMDECYYIGFAYFQLENDLRAIEMYDMAIQKGSDDYNIYLYKGLALRYNKQHEKAIKNFKLAIERNPYRQENYNELANTFYYQNQYDSALVYFQAARKLNYQLGDPYLKLPNIYHVREEFDKALEEYRTSASLIDKNDPIYIELIMNIGLLEFTHTFDYPKSIIAYEKMNALLPERYELYTKLIKAYYGNENYHKGDSLFSILKTKHEHKELNEEMMSLRGEIVDGFVWNEQRVSVMKYFKTPEEFAEPIYQFFILNKEGTKVERKILTEKTMVDLDGVKHLLCGINKLTGAHSTYPVAWRDDNIDYKELKRYVIMILNGEMGAQASSNFGNVQDTKVTKKKKKKKKRD